MITSEVEKKEVCYCPYCGTKLDPGAKFCKNCGEAVYYEPKGSTEKTNERKTTYEGEIHKCPNCGEILNSFMANCPSCGYEIRNAHSSSSVRELIIKLENIEAQKMPPIEEKKSVMKMVFGKDFKEGNEVEEAQKRFDEHKCQQKVNLIINFSVPNTKEDILEFMILASSNINIKRGIDDEITKAWLSKLEQVYERAKLLMGNSPAFGQIKYIYDKKKAELKNRKFKGLAIASFIVGGIILFWGLIFLLAIFSTGSVIFALIGIGVLILGFFFVSIYNKYKRL